MAVILAKVRAPSDGRAAKTVFVTRLAATVRAIRIIVSDQTIESEIANRLLLRVSPFARSYIYESIPSAGFEFGERLLGL